MKQPTTAKKATPKNAMAKCLFSLREGTGLENRCRPLGTEANRQTEPMLMQETHSPRLIET